MKYIKTPEVKRNPGPPQCPADGHCQNYNTVCPLETWVCEMYGGVPGELCPDLMPCRPYAEKCLCEVMPCQAECSMYHY